MATAAVALVGIGIGIGIVGTPSTASAQSPKDIAAARQAFKDGEEAEGRGDLAIALAKFKEALAFKATPQLHLRIGAVQEKSGRLVDALDAYETGLSKAAGLPAVAKIAREQIEALRPRVPAVTLVIAKAPPDLVVTIDGAPVSASTVGSPVPVDPGTHRVHAQATGFLPRDQTFTVAERGRPRLVLDLLPGSGDDGAHPPPAVVADTGPSRLPGALVTGAGGVALIAGVALLASSYAKDSAIDALCGGSARLACPLSMKSAIESDVSTVNALRFGSIPLGLAGAAGLGAGIYLLVRSPKPAAAADVLVVPAPGGVAAVGRF